MDVSFRLYLVARLLAVVDLLQRDGARRKEVTQFGQIDAVPEPLLQLCGGGQLLVQAGLHPPVGGAQCTRDVALHSLASETVNAAKASVYVNATKHPKRFEFPHDTCSR